jgi:predicted amidohydrolase YtcJ
MIEEGLEPIAVTDTTGTVPEASGPLFNIACAMTTKADGGAAPSAEEALSFEDALRMHTVWAAYAGFEERDKGSISAGKLGDSRSSPPILADGRKKSSIELDARSWREIVFER